MHRHPPDLAERLGGFAGDLIAPGHPSYEQARRMFNARIDRRPALIVRCRDEADVKAAVRHGRDRHLPLAVRCMGHSLAGHCCVDGGLVIDTSALKRIEVDPLRQRVRVEAGADLGRARLYDTFPPLLQTVGPRAYVEVQRILDPLVPAGRRYAARAMRLPALSDDAIEALVDHAARAPSPPCEVIVLCGGGALERVAPGSSALAHRDAAATVWLLAAWHDPRDDERNFAWTATGSIALDSFSVGVNLTLTGDEPPERIRTAFAADA